jgi:hypothetical protein
MAVSGPVFVDALNPRQQLAVLQRCEKQRRRIPAVEHPLINSLARQAPSLELGGTVVHAVAEATLISRSEASHTRWGLLTGHRARHQRPAAEPE